MRYLITGASGFIGTNLVGDLLARQCSVLNLDVSPPLNEAHGEFWSECDILNKEKLARAFLDFKPDAVVHLAARTDCDEDTTVEAGYKVNTLGTQNLLDAVRGTPSVKRLVITSSQYVCGPGYTPGHELDFAPHTVYGESKAESERLTRKADPDCTWTIVRPTNIWGPWHMRYRREFWRVVEKGCYAHPAGPPVIRSYGYVGNINWYILKILEAPERDVARRTFYLGDGSRDIYEWANAFSLALWGRPARRIPRALLRSIGMAGSCMKYAGINAPLTLSRYRSMTTDYPANTEEITSLIGDPPFTLKEGVDATVKWLREYNAVNKGPAS